MEEGLKGGQVAVDDGRVDGGYGGASRHPIFAHRILLEYTDGPHITRKKMEITLTLS